MTERDIYKMPHPRGHIVIMKTEEGNAFQLVDSNTNEKVCSHTHNLSDLQEWITDDKSSEPCPKCIQARESSRKATKSEAGYLGNPGVEIRCGTCRFYGGLPNAIGGCAIVEGPVSGHGCCNVWSLSGEYGSKTGDLSSEFLSGKDIEDILGSKVHRRK